jgi:hypothetical protein
MENYSTLIWKIIGAIAVLWAAQKLISFFNNPQAIPTPSNLPIAKPSTVTTSNPQIKTDIPVVKSNQADKVTPNNTPTKVATPEKKEVFSKDSKDRENNLEQRKKALTEKARNNMLNNMSGANQSQTQIVNNQPTPVVTSPVRTLPLVSSPNITSPKVSSPVHGELINPVPLDQQLINNNLSKSSPSPLIRTPVVEEKKPSKPLSQSQSPNRVRKEKPAEEGLCLRTGEIKTIPAKISVEEDRETKRRRALEAFELNKK